MSPRVSILIPAFNQELRFLKECIDSALNQTMRDIEVVVSDNHSTNGTAEFLRGYTDDRLRIVSPASFLSMNDNFAFCASHARGKYLSFLSSDDLLLPHAIETLYGHLERDARLVFGCGNIYSARRLPSGPQRTRFLIREHGDGVRSFTPDEARAFFFPWTMACTWMAGDIIRRDAYEETGGFSKCDMLTTGDVWLTTQLLERGGFLCLDEPLALFRTRSLLKSEIDRDRRLFDFTDLLSSQARAGAGEPSAWRRLRQNASLAYRLGAAPQPSVEALQKSRETFQALGRHDLVRLVDRQLSNDIALRIVGATFGLLNLARKSVQRARHYFKGTRAAR